MNYSISGIKIRERKNKTAVRSQKQKVGVDMINGVWVIRKEAGICIFHCNYGGKEINTQLFSGYVSGIYTLSEMFSKKGGMETLELKDMTFLYGVNSHLIFIVSITKDENIERIREKLTEISREFIYKYKDNLQNWNGNAQVFEPFGVDLNHILERRERGEAVEIPMMLPE